MSFSEVPKFLSSKEYLLCTVKTILRIGLNHSDAAFYEDFNYATETVLLRLKRFSSQGQIISF